MAPLPEIIAACRPYNAYVIVDEAHATGVIGNKGAGLVQQLGLEQECFARIHTFGKAMGCHGAVILGSETLRSYLINFCRPFMYTTALPPASVRAIADAYAIVGTLTAERDHLQQLVAQFQSAAIRYTKLPSRTPIQSVVIPGNEAVKSAADLCLRHHFDVRPILYPTVPKGSERLRIVLHAFNTEAELAQLAAVLG